MSADNQDITNRLMMQLAQAGSPSFNGIQAPANPAGLMSVLAQMQQQNQLPAATPGPYGYLHDASTRGFQQMGQQLGNLSQSNNTATPINPASIQNPFQGMTGAITQAKQTYAAALAGGMPPDAANIKALSGLAQAGVPGAAEKLEEAQTKQATNTKLAAETFKDNSQGAAAQDEPAARARTADLSAKKDTWQTTYTDPQGYYQLQKNGLGETKRVELKPALASLVQSSPDDQATLAKMVANYEMAPYTGSALRTPQASHIMALAKQINPDYDATQYAIKQTSSQAPVKADATSLAQTQKQLSATQSYFDTMHKNIDAAAALAKNIDFTDVKPLNAALAAWKAGTSDPQYAKYNVFFDSVANEYAKIKSGSLGNGTVSDAARKEAMSVLSPLISSQGVNAAFDAVKQEGQNRLDSLTAQRDALAAKISGRIPTGSKPAAAPAPTGPTLTYDPASGTFH